MRSCILPGHARAVLRNWLDEQEVDEGLYMLLHRIRIFEDLERGVEMYLAAKRGMVQASSSP